MKQMGFIFALSMVFALQFSPFGANAQRNEAKKQKDQQKSSGEVDIGDEAPNFEGETPEGDTLSLNEVLEKEGKYTLIEFWGSWCPHCQQEIPKIKKIYDEFHDKGFNIIGVSIDYDRGEWTSFIDEHDLNWEQISNLKKWDDPIVDRYDVRSIPYGFLVDEDGKVLAKHIFHEELKEKLEKLLSN